MTDRPAPAVEVAGSGLEYRSHAAGAAVMIHPPSGEPTHLFHPGDGMVRWPGPSAPLLPLAAGVLHHLTGVREMRSMLPHQLAANLHSVADPDAHDWRLSVDRVNRWIARVAPTLHHTAAPTVGGPGAPPAPPATWEALWASPGRGLDRRVQIATSRGGPGRGLWQAFWLPATGELLSVVTAGTEIDRWPVTRLAANVAGEHAIDLASRRHRTVGEVLDHIRQLRQTAELCVHTAEHERATGPSLDDNRAMEISL